MHILNPATGMPLPEPESLGAASSPATQPSIPFGNSVANQSDAAFFSAALQQPEAASAMGGVGGKPAAMFEKASGMFKQMEGDQKQMNNVLRKAARSTDPLVLNQVDDQLSNYYLESMMNAKIVSKSISGLDKLTNLQ
ncbi:EscI/YscI/HrpB family type III secretion system inner rod protein [Cedecea lapagei]|uniref:EscI/YscI/HrpB family type III secretion system inner rod protein n=1 Tax=Cedecea lapagei TaxID=158823 RepID=UPI001BCB42A2|nr:EscI/YscI/HrpB family type III secretion system inner rod protein [Cedecea lapagei]